MLYDFLSAYPSKLFTRDENFVLIFSTWSLGRCEYPVLKGSLCSGSEGVLDVVGLVTLHGMGA